MEREALILFTPDARPHPWLADRWSSSNDGLEWRIQLRKDVVFHDGRPMTADAVARFLTKRLPEHLGPPAQNIEIIRPVSSHELQFMLKRR